MSREDYISKLFIKNKDKLNQEPSDTLWDKIESNLDNEINISQNEERKIFQLKNLIAAASFLGLISFAFYISNNEPQHINLVLDEQTNKEFITEPEPYDDKEVLPKSFATIDEEKAMRVEESKIVNAVKEKITEEKSDLVQEELAFNDISINDQDDFKSGESVIFIEPETTNENFENLGETDIYQNDVKIEQNTLNYSLSSSQLNNQFLDKNTTNEIISRSTNKREDSENDFKKSLTARNSNSIVSKLEPHEVYSTQSNLSTQLKPFEFFIGEWTDKNESDGISTEIWSIQNENNLKGKCFKTNKNGELIFSETIILKSNLNKVFLSLKFDENGNPVEYMLNKNILNERFVFSQKESNKYPSKIIIQRSKNGFSVIINSSKGLIDSNQQRYLENRNRVTNTAAKRTLSRKQ